MEQDLTPRLAEFAAGPVTTTPDARRVTSLSALDWLAVGRAGATEPVARIVRQMVLDEAGRGEATVFGDGARVPARGAALVNGTVSHALDYDDTHFAHIGHPSVAVFPAALAMAERLGRPVVDLLEASLVGMELSIRVGLWLGRSHYQAGFHQTATAGALGAAAAAGRILGFDAGRMAHALGLAAARATGLKVQFGTMGKPYNAGLAASTGIEVALLIAAGFEANREALEAPLGFGATHHGAGDLAAAIEGLGSVWFFADVLHKFHACCHGLHAALEAAAELDLSAPEIATVEIRTHRRWMTVCNQPAPTTGLGAKFSYQTVIAMRALGLDTARLDVYSDRTCADPRLLALRDRIQVVEDPSLSETEAVLTLLRRDGQRREARHDLLTPIPIATREERVRQKTATLIGSGMTNRIWSLLQQGGRASDLSAFLRVDGVDDKRAEHMM
ncbi:MAG: MmgE/PrpD family protein [Pseudomonadota bacterium]